MKLVINEQKEQVLNAPGNLLIMGGPGSGKTTLALLKAKNILEKGEVQSKQTILFLSFARATVSRVEENAGIILPRDIISRLEITTYHSFAWNLLRCHGYLLNAKPLRLLPPHEASSKLAKCIEKEKEISRLFDEEGIVHFDLFSSKCANLLQKSKSLARLISNAYPVMLFDEFQDTNINEWELISELGHYSRLICLADPNQRIYDFRGASPARVGQFIEKFSPTIFDLGEENNRSTGKDITTFGNDLLTGSNKGKTYSDVTCYGYVPLKKHMQLLQIKARILRSCERLKGISQDWSIAILVPTNSVMITVSDFLNQNHPLANGAILPKISHHVAIEASGPCISATLIAGLLERASQGKALLNEFVQELCEHILGRKGAKPPSKKDIELTTSLQKYLDGKIVKKVAVERIIADCTRVIEICNTSFFSGDVASDWITVRNALASVKSDYIQNIVSDAKYLRLLHAGSNLNMALGQLWKQNHNYVNARVVTRNALTQEHFSTSKKTWRGINVMTIHKAKGKEFDDVIIYEGAFDGQRIVFSQDNLDQARLNLRVAVTRAKSKVFIFTPQKNPCCLL